MATKLYFRLLNLNKSLSLQLFATLTIEVTMLFWSQNIVENFLGRLSFQNDIFAIFRCQTKKATFWRLGFLKSQATPRKLLGTPLGVMTYSLRGMALV